MLENYNFSENNSKRFNLPKKLNEISGLAVTDENRLFAHNDETGTVYEIDIENGKVINQFSLGKKKLKADFEGIAAVKDSLFLVTSSGVLYKFNYPEDEQYIEYKKIKTSLSSKYDIEGLCYDGATNSLLLACKSFPGKGLKNCRSIYSFNIKEERISNSPRFVINLDSLNKKFGIKNFSPTGIEVHPTSGTFIIISSQNKAILELSSDGRILNLVKLKNKYHKQPEGITFLMNGLLILADEGNGGKGFITIINKN